MFLASRILFLCTTKPLPFVRQLVEKDGVLDTLVSVSLAVRVSVLTGTVTNYFTRAVF